MGPSVQSGGIDGIVWSILGQRYTPLQHGPDCMAWHATLPAGTFVPLHVHAAQDEFVHMLGGTLAVETGTATLEARAGSLIRLPRGVPHGLYNRSGQEVTCLFWVTPAARLWALFQAIDGVPDPAEVVRLAALHEVTFLPPG